MDGADYNWIACSGKFTVEDLFSEIGSYLSFDG
jgi:hypothetical protein